jgi:hypothetical protein
MRKNPQTIAWVVMTLSFLLCLVLTIGTPASIRWFILNATQPLEVALEPRKGIVTFQPGGRGAQEVIGEVVEVSPKSRIELSSNDAEALLLFYPPQQPEAPVSTLQINGETVLTFRAARNPIFERSNLPNQIALQVDASKRLQISVGADTRASLLQIATPQGTLQLEEGTYTLVVDAERTEIVVSRGRAHVPDLNDNSTLVLTDAQFVELTADGPSQIQSGSSRDILRNGDFNRSLEPYWEPFTLRKQFADQSDGEVTLGEEGERTQVIFEREGIGHIEVGISQEINQDVRGIESLRVTALLRVNEQSIPLCGIAGTECPLMLRITYLDAQEGSHEWLQGFYALVGSGYSDTCTLCEGSPEHIQIPAQSWYPYTSPDLLPLLSERGAEPATILSVDLYASGHTFRSAIDEVAILTEE